THRHVRERRGKKEEEPPDRQAEQRRRRQVEPSAAPGNRRRRFGGRGLDGQPLTSAQAFAYSARFGMVRSRYAFGRVTAFGFESLSALSSSLELGRPSVSRGL